MSEEILKNEVVETQYDASQIQVLEGLEAVRYPAATHAFPRPSAQRRRTCPGR